MSISTAVDISAVARTIGIKVEPKNLMGDKIRFLPQHVALIAQGNTSASFSTDKARVTSANQVGETYGFGSPLHLAAMQLFPADQSGLGSVPLTVFPLKDHASGVAAAGNITPAGSATKTGEYRILISNVMSEAITISPGDSVATMVTAITTAINAVPAMPVTAVDSATKVDLTAKWKGTTGDDIKIVVSGPSVGVTFAITAPSSGATNPDISSAISQMGGVWYTMIVNGLGTGDSVALDALQVEGEARWSSQVSKPFVAFAGETVAAASSAVSIPQGRADDRINSQLVSPGGNDLPVAVAARQVSLIARQANNNPPVGYSNLAATGLVAGADSDQWTFVERDYAVKNGSSTVEIKDGVVHPSDIITFYAPSGDPLPAYRFVKDIVRIQNLLFNLSLIFNAPGWKDAPLIPDGDPTVNKAARRPKDAAAAVAGLIDQAGLQAIISAPGEAKKTITAGINSQNPNRLDLSFTVQLSGNTNIISIDFGFGFYLETEAAL